MPERSDVTRLLHDAASGDSAAFDQLYEVVYDELVRLARSVRKGGAPETLNTTSLVHEAYFKLVDTPGKLQWNDRRHFFAVAARAMRQVLVNAARDRMAQKRGGGQIAVSIDDREFASVVAPEEFLALHEAINRLESISKRQAKIIEYRFFAGLTVKETADALELSERTVKREWRFARAWLGTELA